MTTSKSDLRRLVRAREAGLAPEERRESDERLVSRLLASPEYRSAGTVLLYCGVGGEPDTRPILEDALRAGKRAALPRITAPGAMEARQVRSPGELVPGAFNIPEPGEGCPLLPPEAFDLVLVPGAAFTRNGARLGRGGGYYDRYLPRVRGKTAALVRRIQLFDTLPTQAHDVPVALVITDE